MRNTDGLRPWQEGESGNPNGRPKKQYSLTSMLREKGEEVLPDGRTRAQALAQKIWELAEDGDRIMAQYLIDRMDGKPKERVEHSESHVAQIVLVTDDGTGTGTAETEAVPDDAG